MCFLFQFLPKNSNTPFLLIKLLNCPSPFHYFIAVSLFVIQNMRQYTGNLRPLYAVKIAFFRSSFEMLSMIKMPATTQRQPESAFLPIQSHVFILGNMTEALHVCLYILHMLKRYAPF